MNLESRWRAGRQPDRNRLESFGIGIGNRIACRPLVTPTTCFICRTVTPRRTKPEWKRTFADCPLASKQVRSADVADGQDIPVNNHTFALPSSKVDLIGDFNSNGHRGPCIVTRGYSNQAELGAVRGHRYAFGQGRGNLSAKNKVPELVRSTSS
jgi:hypothetical protein